MSSEHHFVRDYERHARRLTAKKPLDEAMRLAVGGGDFAFEGEKMVEVLKHFGLQDGMQVVDFGCGSGRLAVALGRSMDVQYAGIDVVLDLLVYAREKSPPHYRFMHHQSLFFPIQSETCDVITAFSVFTHLHPPESYIYLVGMAKALKPGGRVVFSYLDIDEPAHWPEFVSTAKAHAAGTLPHLNAFLARSWISLWAEKLELEVEAFISGAEPRWMGGKPFGQSLVCLRRPGA